MMPYSWILFYAYLVFVNQTSAYNFIGFPRKYYPYDMPRTCGFLGWGDVVTPSDPPKYGPLRCKFYEGFRRDDCIDVTFRFPGYGYGSVRVGSDWGTVAVYKTNDCTEDKILVQYNKGVINCYLESSAEIKCFPHIIGSVSGPDFKLDTVTPALWKIVKACEPKEEWRKMKFIDNRVNGERLVNVKYDYVLTDTFFELENIGAFNSSSDRSDFTTETILELSRTAGTNRFGSMFTTLTSMSMVELSQKLTERLTKSFGTESSSGNNWSNSGGSYKTAQSSLSFTFNVEVGYMIEIHQLFGTCGPLSKAADGFKLKCYDRAGNLYEAGVMLENYKSGNFTVSKAVALIEDETIKARDLGTGEQKIDTVPKAEALIEDETIIARDLGTGEQKIETALDVATIPAPREWIWSKTISRKRNKF